MIKAIRCDQSAFRTVHLSPGMNVILADRTHQESTQDSRNGLGKSSLIEVIHFCLGSKLRQSGLTSPELRGWTFTLDLELGGESIALSRNTEFPQVVSVRGDMTDWRGGRQLLPLGNRNCPSMNLTNSWDNECLVYLQVLPQNTIRGFGTSFHISLGEPIRISLRLIIIVVKRR